MFSVTCAHMKTPKI
uniref:Uncharacterized protein n=1 Tax=Lepeophtheirus salmonis TaxID=72036 RepID=A0A0K2V5X4_LEPSM